MVSAVPNGRLYSGRQVVKGLIEVYLKDFGDRIQKADDSWRKTIAVRYQSTIENGFSVVRKDTARI